MRTVSAKWTDPTEEAEVDLLITNLSFSHFIELLKAETEKKKRFYETQAIKNYWSVRDLKRAIDSLLYERTGLSKNKGQTLKEFEKTRKYLPKHCSVTNICWNF